MIIRAFTPADLCELERIHSLHFKDEFDMPDFTKYICAYVIEDDKGIITFGGIRDIAECVTVTNKDRSPIERLTALYQVLEASKFVCNKVGYDQIYVWSQNPHWARRLMKNGFRPPDGVSLIKDL